MIRLTLELTPDELLRVSGFLTTLHKYVPIVEESETEHPEQAEEPVKIKAGPGRPRKKQAETITVTVAEVEETPEPEQVAEPEPAPVEVVEVEADNIPDLDAPDLTWEGVRVVFRDYAVVHGQTALVTMMHAAGIKRMGDLEHKPDLWAPLVAQAKAAP